MRTLLLATGLLLTGLLYYAIFRVAPGMFNDPTQGSFPSFIFVLSASLASASLVHRRTLLKLRYASGWLLVVLVAEILFGVTDTRDMIAAVAGFGFASIIIWRMGNGLHRPSCWNHFWIAGLGVALLAGSYMPSDYVHPDDRRAVYLSYADLRSAVTVEASRSMDAMGNLYLYSDRLYINEKNKGLHVIDNRNPADPKAEAFIKIPGNTNVSIRSGFLYADSFVDLVVLDIRDPDNIQEINRQIDVFPYDAYQTIVDENVYLYDVDKDRGVVIGYE